MDDVVDELSLVIPLKYQLLSCDEIEIIKRNCVSDRAMLKFVLSVATTMDMDRYFFVLDDEVTKKLLCVINCMKVVETNSYNIESELEVISNYLEECIYEDNSSKQKKKLYYQMKEEKRRKATFINEDALKRAIAYDAVTSYAISTGDYNCVADLNLFLQSVSSLASKVPDVFVKYNAMDDIINMCNVYMNICKSDDYEMISYCEYIIGLMKELKNSKKM